MKQYAFQKTGPGRISPSAIARAKKPLGNRAHQVGSRDPRLVLTLGQSQSDTIGTINSRTAGEHHDLGFRARGSDVSTKYVCSRPPKAGVGRIVDPETSDSVEKLCSRSSGRVSRDDELTYSVVLSFLFPYLLYLINPHSQVAFGRGVPYAAQGVGGGCGCVSHRASRFRFWAVAAK